MKNILHLIISLILFLSAGTLGYFYFSTNNQLNTAENNLTALQAEFIDINNKTTELQEQLTNANLQISDLQEQLETITPKPFPDKAALQDWVDLNIELIEEAAKSLDLHKLLAVQYKALQEGWIVNAVIVISSSGYSAGLQALTEGEFIYSISVGANPGKITYIYSQ
jgi:septal ring factor EnvC (AmiA/AmiB activator)